MSINSEPFTFHLINELHKHVYNDPSIKNKIGTSLGLLGVGVLAVVEAIARLVLGILLSPLELGGNELPRNLFKGIPDTCIIAFACFTILQYENATM